VARDHDLESRGLRLQVELREIVEHVDGDDADTNDFGLGQLTRPWRLVDIPANGGYGRDDCEFLKDLGSSDVTGMEDVVRSLQRGKSFGAKQSVRVGDDADYDVSLNSLAFDWS
jgi:hypothetical protein